MNDTFDNIRANLEQLEKGAGRVVEYTLNSTSFQILKNIRRPEALGGWPIDTRTSYKKWGFEPAEIKGEKVIFTIFNDATVNEQRATRGAKPLSKNGDLAYAAFTYAKGDGLLRRPIAPNIVKNAIVNATENLENTFFRVLNKFLTKRGRDAIVR